MSFTRGDNEPFNREPLWLFNRKPKRGTLHLYFDRNWTDVVSCHCAWKRQMASRLCFLSPSGEEQSSFVTMQFAQPKFVVNCWLTPFGINFSRLCIRLQPVHTHQYCCYWLAEILHLFKTQQRIFWRISIANVRIKEHAPVCSTDILWQKLTNGEVC